MDAQTQATVFDFSWKRLILLSLSSIVLFLLASMLPFLYFFIPFPLVSVLIYFGREKTYPVFFGMLLLVGTITYFVQTKAVGYMMVFYGVAQLVSVIVGEIIIRQFHPRRATLVASAVLFVVVFLGSTLYIQGNKELLNIGIQKQLVEVEKMIPSSDKQDKEKVQELLRNPELKKAMLGYIPPFLYVISFIWIWMMLYFSLKGYKLLSFIKGYPYTLKDLTLFKTPGWLIYPVVGCLGLILMPVETIGETTQVVSQGMLYVLGSLYFLQGLGIYLDFLTSLGIFGILRSMLLAITVLFGHTLLAAIGLFDLWLNFRKYFRKENKGDTP